MSERDGDLSMYGGSASSVKFYKKVEPLSCSCYAQMVSYFASTPPSLPERASYE